MKRQFAYTMSCGSYRVILISSVYCTYGSKGRQVRI